MENPLIMSEKMYMSMPVQLESVDSYGSREYFQQFKMFKIDRHIYKFRRKNASQYSGS